MVDPPSIIQALGQFDLDPCQPITPPWKTANMGYNKLHDGLKLPWFGRIWMNPPYGKDTFVWMEKLAAHGNGIALIFARTETKGFHREIWQKADGIFFFEGRLNFHYVDGRKGDAANAPSCLVAFGNNNIEAIKNSGLKGKLVIL